MSVNAEMKGYNVFRFLICSQCFKFSFHYVDKQSGGFKILSGYFSKMLLILKHWTYRPIPIYNSVHIQGLCFFVVFFFTRKIMLMYKRPYVDNCLCWKNALLILVYLWTCSFVLMHNMKGVCFSKCATVELFYLYI